MPPRNGAATPPASSRCGAARPTGPTSNRSRRCRAWRSARCCESGDCIVARRYREDPGCAYGTKLQVVESDRLSNPHFASDTAGHGRRRRGRRRRPPHRLLDRDRHPGDRTIIGVGADDQVADLQARDAEGRLLDAASVRSAPPRPGARHAVPGAGHSGAEDPRRLFRVGGARGAHRLGLLRVRHHRESRRRKIPSSARPKPPPAPTTRPSSTPAPSSTCRPARTSSSPTRPGPMPGSTPSSPPSAGRSASLWSCLTKCSSNISPRPIRRRAPLSRRPGSSFAAAASGWSSGSASRSTSGSWRRRSRPAASTRRGSLTTPSIRHAWCRADWVGSARISLDPLKDANADTANIENGTTSRERITRERFGTHVEIVTKQLGREKRARSDEGLDAPPPAAAWRPRPAPAPAPPLPIPPPTPGCRSGPPNDGGPEDETLQEDVRLRRDSSLGDRRCCGLVLMHAGRRHPRRHRVRYWGRDSPPALGLSSVLWIAGRRFRAGAPRLAACAFPSPSLTGAPPDVATMLARLADRVLGRPLFLHPAKAEWIVWALSGRIGIDDVAAAGVGRVAFRRLPPADP
jgi:hypothetical protein